jgi:hypothetical protein
MVKGVFLQLRQISVKKSGELLMKKMHIDKVYNELLKGNPYE